MGDDKDVAGGEKKESGVSVTSTAAQPKKKKGIVSRIWNSIFGRHGDDFEKRLQYISKEEASVLSRMKRRSQTWRRMVRHLIVFSIIFEVIAVGYAIATTRSTDLNWKMRAFRVLPMFVLPAISSLSYSALVSFIKMRDRKDQNTLERLREEKQAKIDELKEKTNYYITQQLIQRYDPDPAAKAAAASVLASKLGADSGLKVVVGDDLETSGRSNDVELAQHGRQLRNRKQARQAGPASAASTLSEEVVPHSAVNEGAPMTEHEQLVVNHHFPQGPSAVDGGWVARIAALLVGEDPTQSYALICGNCHMHNGLARKEDFPFITYYCPHCQALNRPKQSEERVSGSSTPNPGSARSAGSSDAMKTAPKQSEERVSGSSTPNPGSVRSAGSSDTLKTANDPVTETLVADDVSPTKSPSTEIPEEVAGGEASS